MIVQLELTRTTVFSLVFVFCLAVLVPYTCIRWRPENVVLRLCVGEFQFIQELGFGGFGESFCLGRASDKYRDEENPGRRLKRSQ